MNVLLTIILIWIVIVVVFISSIVRRVGRHGNKNNNRYVCYFCMSCLLMSFFSWLLCDSAALIPLSSCFAHGSASFIPFSVNWFRFANIFLGRLQSNLYAPIWSETPVAFIPLVVSNLISLSDIQIFPLDVVYPYPLHVVLASLLYINPMICSLTGPDWRPSNPSTFVEKPCFTGAVATVFAGAATFGQGYNLAHFSFNRVLFLFRLPAPS